MVKWMIQRRESHKISKAWSLPGSAYDACVARCAGDAGLSGKNIPSIVALFVGLTPC